MKSSFPGQLPALVHLRHDSSRLRADAATAAGKTEEGSRQMLQGFESILLRQLIAALRSTAQTGGLFGSVTGQQIYDHMIESALADHLAAAGGLGIARALGSPLPRYGKTGDMVAHDLSAAEPTPVDEAPAGINDLSRVSVASLPGRSSDDAARSDDTRMARVTILGDGGGNRGLIGRESHAYRAVEKIEPEESQVVGPAGPHPPKSDRNP